MSSRHDIVDRLRHMLAKANVSDADLDGGARLTQQGERRAAKVLGIDPSEMPLLIRALIQRIRDERQRFDTMNEDLGHAAPRFSVEPDALGNVTLRDGHSGDSRFLSGTRASALINRIKGSDAAQQQEILAAIWGQGAPVSEARIEPTRPRAMKATDEVPADEADHWDAKDETGFYGRQGAGCVVIAQDTGRVLVMLRSNGCEEPGTWGNCGGAVDEGAAPREHALQELYEETGYRGEVSAMIPLLVFQSGSFRYSNFLAVVPKEFKPSLNWETDDPRWCTLADWPQPLHFGLEALFSDPASLDKIERVAGAGGSVHESVEHADGRLMEDDEIEPAILDEEEDFVAEIRRGTGTFNFTWTVGAKRGFGTAAFRPASRGAPLAIKLVSVQDGQGRVIEPDPALSEKIHAQAVAFIGHE